jgi:hypothetical protein
MAALPATGLRTLAAARYVAPPPDGGSPPAIAEAGDGPYEPLVR